MNNPLAGPTLSEVPANDKATVAGGDGPQGTSEVRNIAVKSKGRPKASADGGEAPKRGRGRPKKTESSGVAKEQKSATIEILAESLRKAGETLSSSYPEDTLNFDVTAAAAKSGGENIPKAKRPRGRPRKNPDQPPKPSPAKDGPKRGRGRPRKSDKPGRPRKRPLDESVGQESSPKKPRANGDKNEEVSSS